MSDQSAIEWTDSTWNPVRGCTKVSAGCKHCYAERFAERFRGVPGHPFEQGFDLRLVPSALELPLRWKTGRLIFVNSMSDLFHEEIPDAYIEKVFDVMARASQHQFQVLTKRAERMRAFTSRRSVPQNAWMGVSVETAEYRWRIQHLRSVPAAVRFLSLEPLLGSVDTLDLRGIHWVIVGGESGPGARPCDVAWIRSLVEQCRAAQVPAFVKQLGAHVLDRNDAGFEGDDGDAWPAGTDVEHDERDTGFQGAPVRVRLRDRKGGDMKEWPADLRIRQMPGEV